MDLSRHSQKTAFLLIAIGIGLIAVLGGCVPLPPSETPVSPLSSSPVKTPAPPFPTGMSGQVLFHRQTGGRLNIFVMDLATGNLTQLTEGQGNNYDPIWSPDGSQIAFISDRDQRPPYGGLWLMNADGSNQHALLESGSYFELGPTWSPDGTRIAFQSNREGNPEILILTLATGELTNLTRHPNVDANPAWSPDGSQIAFASDRSGNPEIWVIDADGMSWRQVTQRPMKGDWRPAWSPDGQRLIFESYPTVPPRLLHVQGVDEAQDQEIDTFSVWNTWPAWMSDDLILYAASETYDVNTQKPSPTHLYIQNLQTGDLYQLTTGSESDGRPSWKP